jgi:hypothetical protein
LFLISLFGDIILSAQQNKNDSLRQLLVVAKEDTSKVNLLNQLSRNFNESKPDSNLFYGLQLWSYPGRSTTMKEKLTHC